MSDDSRALLDAWREDEKAEQSSMADFHAGKWGKYGQDGKKIDQPPVQITINITPGQPPEVK